MAIQYAGGTTVNTTFVSDGTRRQLVDQLAAALTTAGWSTISGAGTADVLMKTAVTPQGSSVRLRIYDPGANNCAQICLKHSNGTAAGIMYLLPTNGRTFRIIANKYQFFYFASGAAYAVTSDRQFCCGGTLYVPDFIVSVQYGDLECGWTNHSSTSDSAYLNNSFSNRLGSGDTIGLYGESIFAGVVLTFSSYLHYAPSIIYPMLGVYQATNAYRWQDNSLHAVEPIMAWSSGPAVNNEPKAKGQLFDALVINGPVDRESLITFDGHTFMAITNQAPSTYSATLYVMVS